MKALVSQVRVRDVMSTDVITLSAGQSIPLAADLMRLARIRHLPVVDDDGRLVGLVTHRDLLDARIGSLAAMPEEERSELELRVPVSQVMRTDVWTVTPGATALSAARMMHDHAFGCLPVLEDGELVGILSEADLVSLLIDSLDMDARHGLGEAPELLVDRRGGGPRVEAAMRTSPRTVDADERVGEARRILSAAGQTALPIVRGEQPIGVAVDSELRLAVAVHPAGEGVPVGSLCARAPVRLDAEASLAAAALELSARGAVAALVYQRGELVGVVTVHDVGRALAEP